ncbi:M15 family metallopeptidase, partial [Georgenia sp. 10Sc9-8]|nr:M15 family metallopeptidase [Georgenia halotolerans]
RAQDRVYVGDFDGDRDDSFTVRRGIEYHVANQIRGGEADRVVVYGRATDGAIVGDWNGDGVDSLGVQRLKPALERIPDGWVTDVSGADLSAASYDARNGRLSHQALCPIPFLPSHAVHCSALDGLVDLNAAYQARFGHPLPINPAPYTTYRSYADQLHVWAETGPPTAARPGTSPHGWGLSMDLGFGDNELEFGEQPYLWLHANAPRFGWRNQSWNQEGGSNPEPWHFDYVG